MSVEVVLGLPYLSPGALTRTARKLAAPVLLSASAFSKNRNHGPVPDRWLPPARRGATGRRPNMLEWDGWNLSQLRHAEGLASIDLDSAGFVAMALKGGYEWSPREYVLGLCAAFPWRRFSSMDMCVEPEVATDRDEVRQRIARTIALNRECRSIADDAGIGDRLMPVVQGATASDYLRCFDAMQSSIRSGSVIGVGSMCRRPTGGTDGIVSIVEELDRSLPRDVTLHLFGLKSDGAEAICSLHQRVASIDSQAYGVRARRIANDERRRDPSFSKTNDMVAGVMESWWLAQVERMSRGRSRPIQTTMPMPPNPEPRPRTVWDALEMRARAETNQMISLGEMGWNDGGCANDLLGHVQILMEDLPNGVSPGDAYSGIHQMPESVRTNWPCHVPPEHLHPAIRPTGPHA